MFYILKNISSSLFSSLPIIFNLFFFKLCVCLWFSWLRKYLVLIFHAISWQRILIAVDTFSLYNRYLLCDILLSCVVQDSCSTNVHCLPCYSMSNLQFSDLRNGQMEVEWSCKTWLHPEHFVQLLQEVVQHSCWMCCHMVLQVNHCFNIQLIFSEILGTVKKG